RLLKHELTGWAGEMTRARAMELLAAKAPEAQELGGIVIGERSVEWASSFETAEIVLLAGHEIQSVRSAAHSILASVVDRFHLATNADAHREVATLLGALDVEWEDTRERLFDLFRATLEPEDFTPDILVAICDSSREPAQQLGRELVTKL